MHKKIFALHPGLIRSANDHQLHYIDGRNLMKLYELPLEMCFIWDEKHPASAMGAYYDDYLHLFPRYYGDYVVTKDTINHDQRSDRFERLEAFPIIHRRHTPLNASKMERSR